MRRLLTYCARAWCAGFLISIGAGVYLVLGRGLAGSLMFSLGLLSIILFRLPLFTGAIGFASDVPKLIELFGICLPCNIMGAAFCGAMLSQTTPLVSDHAAVLIAHKLSLTPWNGFCRGIVCGALMLVAVLPWPRNAQDFRSRKADTATKSLLTMLSVASFLLLSGEHCIAFAAFWSMSGAPDFWQALPWFLSAVAGNTVGAWCLRAGIIS